VSQPVLPVHILPPLFGTQAHAALSRRLHPLSSAPHGALVAIQHFLRFNREDGHFEDSLVPPHTFLTGNGRGGVLFSDYPTLVPADPTLAHAIMGLSHCPEAMDALDGWIHATHPHHMEAPPEFSVLLLRHATLVSATTTRFLAERDARAAQAGPATPVRLDGLLTAVLDPTPSAHLRMAQYEPLREAGRLADILFPADAHSTPYSLPGIPA